MADIIGTPGKSISKSAEIDNKMDADRELGRQVRKQAEVQGLADAMVQQRELAKLGIRGLIDQGVDPTTKYDPALVDEVMEEDYFSRLDQLAADNGGIQFPPGDMPVGLARELNRN